MKIYNENTPSEQPEPGLATLVCCGIVDMGTQPSQLYKPRRELAIFFETPDQIRQEGDYAGTPFRLRITVNRTMSPKGSLVKWLESWRGRQFTEEEHEMHKTQGYDAGKLIGVMATGNIIVNDKGYANIDSLARGPKGRVVEPNVRWYLDLDAFDPHEFSDLPEFLQKKIQASPEYKEAIKPKPAARPAQAVEPVDLSGFNDIDGGSDEVPF